MSLARDLAGFVIEARPDARSEEALRILRLSLFDWMACGMAGAQEPVARLLREVKPQHADGRAVFGATARFAAADAALINGATSHALDYDDTHFDHIGHPSVAIFPAVMAVSRGGEALWAALLGAEVSVRVGLWLGRSHYQTGFHQTATAGAFGATAAAGRLLGLDMAQMQAAFGLAATQAAGLKSQFGTMGKPYHAGLAARSGVEAAKLAAIGFDTRGAGLDGAQGFGPTHHGEANTEALDGLGSEWRMQHVSHKFHACCHGLHAMLEALAGARSQPERIAEIVVRTHPRWLSVCNIAAPQTGLETKFSYRHSAAMALTGRATSALTSYTDALAHAPDLVALRGKVTVIPDATLSETEAQVRITQDNGSQECLQHDLQAPLGYETRADRLRTKARALLGDALEDQLWQATHGERAPDPDALEALMTTHPG